MSRFIASAMIVATVLTMSGCGSQNAPSGTVSEDSKTASRTEQAAVTPFTLDYQYSENQIKSFTENDTSDTIVDAGPLYLGNMPSEQPGLQVYRELKETLVQQIVTASAQLHTDSVRYATEVKNLKNKYIDYLGQVLEQNKKLNSQVKSLAQEIIELEVQYQSNFALYNSIDPAVSANPASQAMWQYQKTGITLKNLELLSADTARIVGGLATLEETLRTNEDPQIQEIGTALSNEIPSAVDSLGKSLLALQQQGEALNAMLQQINAAEYLMGYASVQFVEDSLGALQPQIDTLTEREGLTAEDIAFMKALAAQYKEFTAGIKEQLDANVPPAVTASIRNHNSIVPEAYADEPGYAQRAFDMLKSAGKQTLQAGKTLGTLTWEGTKGTLQTIRTTAGVTLDTLSAGTKSGFDVIFGAANGNSVKEIASEIGSNFVKIKDNFDKGKSGSETLQTAKGYFDAAENAGGDAAASAVESTIGKGWTSWAAGHVGKITVNMFTGFGKGMTKIADPQSTTGDIAEGTLDVGLSFIGGSKVIASGSQIAKGSKDLLQLVGKDGINFVKRVLTSGEIKNIKGITAEILANTKLTPAQVEQLITNALEVEIKEGMQKQLLAVSKNIDQEFVKLLKEGGKTVAENLAGSKEAYAEFVKQAFEHSMKGYKDALLTVLGKDFTSYINNLVGSKADDYIKAAVKEYMDTHSIPGVNTAPPLQDLAGSWENGTVTITDVAISEEIRKQAQEDGCDLSELENQKGKSQPLTMSILPTSDTEGNILTTDAEGKTEYIPFTYSDGVIKATTTQQGAEMNMTMTISEEGGKYKVSGPMEISYKGDEGGELKITANTNASKEIPLPPPPPTPAPAD